MKEDNGRLSQSIVALCRRIEGLPIAPEPPVRIKLISDVRSVALDAYIRRSPITRHWLEVGADILEKALYLRAPERQVFEEFARKALLSGFQAVIPRGGGNGGAS